MAKAGSSLKPQVTMARRELDLALGKSAVSQAAIDELKAEAATLDARKSADQAPAASRLSPAAFAARTAAQYRSLRQAAEALNIRQSTLSRGLRDLEYQLGTVLFSLNEPMVAHDQRSKVRSSLRPHGESSKRLTGCLWRAEDLVHMD
jgi:hypothetical protein